MAGREVLSGDVTVFFKCLQDPARLSGVSKANEYQGALGMCWCHLYAGGTLRLVLVAPAQTGPGRN